MRAIASFIALVCHEVVSIQMHYPVNDAEDALKQIIAAEAQVGVADIIYSAGSHIFAEARFLWISAPVKQTTFS